MKLSQILGQTDRNFLGLNEIEKRKIAMTGIERLIDYKKDIDKKTMEKKFGNGMKLNLGCGNRKMKDFTNIDSRKTVSPDVVWDLENGLPKTIKNDSVTGIFASNILEHINNFIPLMEDIYKVCKKDAIVEIIVPHYKSHHAFSDPTHVKFFTEHTFEYFNQEHRKKNIHSFDYDIKCDYEILDTIIDEEGLMRVILKAKKEEKNADKRRRKD